MAEEVDQFDQMEYEHNWEKTMVQVIKGIENAVNDLKEQGLTPTALLVRGNTIDQIISFCNAEMPKWIEPVFLNFAEVDLQVFRTNDLRHGQVKVL